MDVAYITALSALGGSLVGGLTSGFTTWLTQRSKTRAGSSPGKCRGETTSTTPLSSRHQKHMAMPSPATSQQIQELVALYAMISRMRVLAFPRTVECAEKTMREVKGTYTAPNRTMLELHELIKERRGGD